MPCDSVVNVTALATVDRRDLDERIGCLPDNLSADLEGGLRAVLEL